MTGSAALGVNATLIVDEFTIANLGRKPARERLSQGLHNLPRDGMPRSRGYRGVPTRIIAPTRSEG